MRRLTALLLVGGMGLAVCLLAGPKALAATIPVLGDQRDLKVENLGAVPLAFTENRGQWDERVRFRASAGGATIWFCRDGITYQFTHRVSDSVPHGLPGDAWEGNPQQAAAYSRSHWQDSIETVVVRAAFVGADPNVEVVGDGLLDYRCNYFLGNDPAKWQTEVPSFAAVVYRGVHPGIELRYEGQGGTLVSKCVVAEGAGPTRVQFQYEGSAPVGITNTGEAIINTPWGSVQLGPVSPSSIAWAEVRLTNASAFGLVPTSGSASRASTSTAIELVYSTYLGGNSEDWGTGIAVDASGNAYVTGRTLSPNFPTQSPYDSILNGGDVFVTKLSPDGDAAIYSTYLGGMGNEEYAAIAVDDSGCVYVTGGTSSADFPTQNAYDDSYDGTEDAFVAKLSREGNALLFGTFLGGSGGDVAYGIAVDPSRSAYVAGYTGSPDFPTQDPYDASFSNAEAFVAKLTVTGNALAYSTFLGGSFIESASSIAVDVTGSAYVFGWTRSVDFPTENPYDGTYNGSADAFIAKLTSSGNALVYSTYLGGMGDEMYGAIAVDDSGCAYVTGATTSADLPTQNAYWSGPELVDTC